MKNKKIYLLFSFLIVLLSISIVNKTLQNDTFSAIKIGDYILHNGIDFVEHFNFNTLNYHNARWLFNIVLAFIYNNYDFLGIYLFVIINSIVLGLIMFNASFKYSKSILSSFVITFISLELIANSIVARAHTISYILLLLEVLFIEKLINKNKIKYIFVIIILSILLANIHTTVWLMSLVLYLPYFAEYFFSKVTKNNVFYSETNSIKLLSISFILTALSGLCTPLGFLPYTYIFKTLSGFSSSFILELQRANVFFNYVLLIPFIIYIYLLVYKRRKIKISDLFMVLGLFIMSLMAIRNIPLFIVISVICLSRLIKDNINISSVDNLLNNRLIISFITVFIILLSLIFFLKNNIISKYVDEKLYPTKASDYIINNLDLEKMRLYNDFDPGAYLEFRGIKVFLDSRSEIYCKEFNDTSILEDWYNSSRLITNYKTVFNKYNFNYILLYKSEILNNYVSLDNDYKIIYSDDYFILYEKVE